MDYADEASNDGNASEVGSVISEADSWFLKWDIEKNQRIEDLRVLEEEEERQRLELEEYEREKAAKAERRRQVARDRAAARKLSLLNQQAARLTIAPEEQSGELPTKSTRNTRKKRAGSKRGKKSTPAKPLPIIAEAPQPPQDDDDEDYDAPSPEIGEPVYENEGDDPFDEPGPSLRRSRSQSPTPYDRREERESSAYQSLLYNDEDQDDYADEVNDELDRKEAGGEERDEEEREGEPEEEEEGSGNDEIEEEEGDVDVERPDDDSDQRSSSSSSYRGASEESLGGPVGTDQPPEPLERASTSPFPDSHSPSPLGDPRTSSPFQPMDTEAADGHRPSPSPAPPDVHPPLPYTTRNVPYPYPEYRPPPIAPVPLNKIKRPIGPELPYKPGPIRLKPVGWEVICENLPEPRQPRPPEKSAEAPKAPDPPPTTDSVFKAPALPSKYQNLPKPKTTGYRNADIGRPKAAQNGGATFPMPFKTANGDAYAAYQRVFPPKPRGFTTGPQARVVEEPQATEPPTTSITTEPAEKPRNPQPYAVFQDVFPPKARGFTTGPQAKVVEEPQFTEPPTTSITSEPTERLQESRQMPTEIHTTWDERHQMKPKKAPKVINTQKTARANEYNKSAATQPGPSQNVVLPRQLPVKTANSYNRDGVIQHAVTATPSGMVPGSMNSNYDSAQRNDASRQVVPRARPSSSLRPAVVGSISFKTAADGSGRRETFTVLYNIVYPLLIGKLMAVCRGMTIDLPTITKEEIITMSKIWKKQSLEIVTNSFYDYNYKMTTAEERRKTAKEALFTYHVEQAVTVALHKAIEARELLNQQPSLAVQEAREREENRYIKNLVAGAGNAATLNNGEQAACAGHFKRQLTSVGGEPQAKKPRIPEDDDDIVVL